MFDEDDAIRRLDTEQEFYDPYDEDEAEWDLDRDDDDDDKEEAGYGWPV